MIRTRGATSFCERCLVDTNVLSELTKPLPDPQVEAFLRQSKDRVFVSVLSIGEIRKGVASLPTSKRRVGLEDWLDNEILPWFANRVLPVTLALWWRVASLTIVPNIGVTWPRSRK